MANKAQAAKRLAQLKGALGGLLFFAALIGPQLIVEWLR